MTSTNDQNAAGWPESWLTLPTGLRTGRYTDPEFAKLERDNLWFRVWQFAARLDEIPEVGDYTTYEILGQSVMIVRASADRVKAYFNFCPHRGTTLSEGAGSFENQAIICPYHGWKWNLHGQIEFILEREEFDCCSLRDQDVALREAHCEVFEGFVFVSLAQRPQPFAEFIEPVRQRIMDLKLGEMHDRWWASTIGPCNWKVAQEAFMETFHVSATHPQLDDLGRGVIFENQSAAGKTFIYSHVKYDAFANGHGRFYSEPSTSTSAAPISNRNPDPKPEELEAMIKSLELQVVGLDTMVTAPDLEVAKSLRGKKVPKGSSYGEEFVKALYMKAAEEKRPMPECTPEMIAQWGGEIFVFPNLLMLPMFGNVMIYRIRPNGLNPDSAIFEVRGTRGVSPGTKVPRSTPRFVSDPTDPAQLPLIPRQDFGNVPRVQKGLHSLANKQVWLGKEHEKIIRNMHQELDRWLLNEK